MKGEIEAATVVLIGKPLWTRRRAASMATFQFGDRRKTVDYYGRPCEVGEYALHVDCAWRITHNDRVVVGSRDLYYPADYDNKSPVPDDFDWDRDPTCRDRLIGLFFENGTREYIVQSNEAGMAGGLRIGLSQGYALEVFPDDSLGDEYWRLFSPEKDEPHFVVKGHGIET